MSIPLISIIIPTFNSSNFLTGTIESALAQTYTNIEVIVINDGSTDNTNEIILPYFEKISYVIQENKGLSTARNAGFKISKGSFICFLDADDLLLPNKFEKQILRFQEEQDLGVVISSYYDVENDGKTIIQLVKKTWNRDGLHRLLTHEVFPPHTALIRREVLEKSNLFPENIDVKESQEDWQLWLDIALNGTVFGSIPEPTCLYRRNVKGSISSNMLKHMNGARRVVKWLQNDPKCAKYKVEVQKLSQIVEMETVARAWQAGDLETAKMVFFQAIDNSPDFWLYPDSYNYLFLRSLSIEEESRWTQEKNSGNYRNRLINEFLPVFAPIIATKKFRRITAAAEMACANLAYSWGDSTISRMAVFSSIRQSFSYVLSNYAIKNTFRNLLGPSIVASIRKVQRLW